ncbi:MAG: hypothetical protein R2837_11260 [Aliarcobacter sp.]
MKSKIDDVINYLNGKKSEIKMTMRSKYHKYNGRTNHKKRTQLNTYIVKD